MGTLVEAGSVYRAGGVRCKAGWGDLPSRSFRVAEAKAGGQGEIRTLDTLASMPHFECGAFNRSATCPRRRIKYLAAEPKASAEKLPLDCHRKPAGLFASVLSPLPSCRTQPRRRLPRDHPSSGTGGH